MKIYYFLSPFADDYSLVITYPLAFHSFQWIWLYNNGESAENTYTHDVKESYGDVVRLV